MISFGSILTLLLVNSSAIDTIAFAPPSSVGARNDGRQFSLVEPLGMNKKKKNSPLPNAKGFGSPPSSGSSAFTATTILPKTTPNFRYAGSIRPGRQSPKRDVPHEKVYTFPDYAFDGRPKSKSPLFPWVIEVKKPEEIEKMRAAGRAAREVLDLAGREVRPGITT